MATNTLTDKGIRAELKKAEASAKPPTLNDGGGLTLICLPVDFHPEVIHRLH